MLKLNLKNKTKAMGIYFSGIGISILFSDIVVKTIMFLNFTWQISWFTLSFIALILSIYTIHILSFEKNKKIKSTRKVNNKSIFSPLIIILAIAYFTEGVGFVVQATFLPDIINSIDGLKGYGDYTWSIVGFAAILSSIILMNLAYKYGSINIIIFAMLLQVVGILIPTMTNNIYANLLSGILYGGTFTGLVALFMHLGGKLVPENPVILMATFTVAYGIGQVIAPLYSIYFYEFYNNYNVSLYITASIVFLD